MSSAFRLLLLFIALAFIASSGALAANNDAVVAGTVRNGTYNRAATGEDVVLLRLGNGMREVARAKTNTRGEFRLPLQDPSASYLLRVIYADVAYYARVSSSSPVAVTVFDSRKRVGGVTGAAEIMRISASEHSMHVSDMYELENASSPPVTQAGPQAFEFFLPTNAKLDTVLAAAPEGMAVLVSARLLDGESGRWAVDFPIRPGKTKFAVNYYLPYAGHIALAPRITFPERQFAVMLPGGMTFSGGSPEYHELPAGNSEFKVAALKDVLPGALATFQLSGFGTLPPIGESSAAHTTRPASAIAGVADSSRLTLTQTLVRVVLPTFLIFLALVIVLGWQDRRSDALRLASAPPASPRAASPDVLKQELWHLEVKRLQGSITAEDYRSARRRLDRNMRDKGRAAKVSAS